MRRAGFVVRDLDGHDDIFAEARLFRIGVTGENREGAVDLLGEHDAGEFVGHGKRGERDFLFGRGAEVSREAFRIAAEEDEFARAAVAQIAEPFCELLRGELLARGVEQNDRRARVEFKFAKRSGASSRSSVISTSA